MSCPRFHMTLAPGARYPRSVKLKTKIYASNDEKVVRKMAKNLSEELNEETIFRWLSYYDFSEVVKDWNEKYAEVVGHDNHWMKTGEEDD